MNKQVQAIHDEIDKLYAEYKDKFHQHGDQYHLGLIDGLDMAERVLDTLTEKQPSKDLEEAVEKLIDEALYKWSYDDEDGIEQYVHDAFIAGAQWQKEQSFTHHKMDESLQDAVTHQMEDDGDVDDFVRKGIDNIAMKYAELGAKWMAEHTEDYSMPEDTVLFNKGVAEGKRLMMEDAIDGECIDDTNAGAEIDTEYGVLFLPPHTFRYEDKVKIIIVKEEDEK